MNAPVRRTRIAMVVTCCCLGWNCLCLLLRSQPWSRETFGVAEKSDLVSVNVIIDFVYATNAASDILLIWVIYYHTNQRNAGAIADSELVRGVLKLFIAWNSFAVFLLWCLSCVTSVQTTFLQVPLNARRANSNESTEVNITPGALIGSETRGGFRFWTPLAVFTVIALIRVAVLMYCFVGYLSLLSECASDSVFDSPVDIIPSSTASLSSVPRTPSMRSRREYGASSRMSPQASTSHASLTKISDAQTTAHFETTVPSKQRRKTKRGVAATPTLSSLSEGVVLRVVPGPAFKRPSYVCSVSPPNMRHSRQDDGGRSDEDTPSSGMPASFDAIQAATLASIFGHRPWGLGGGRLPTRTVPSPDSPGHRVQIDAANTNAVEAPPTPIGELRPGASCDTACTRSENDGAATSAAVETPLTPPAGAAATAAKPSCESAAKKRKQRRKGKRFAFGSQSRRSGRRELKATPTPSTPIIPSVRKKRSDKEMAPLSDLPFAADDLQRRVGNEDDVRSSGPTPESATSIDGSSELVGSMAGACRRAASPLVTFVFRTPPSTLITTEDVTKSCAVTEHVHGCCIVAPPAVEKREQAVQTDIC